MTAPSTPPPGRPADGPVELATTAIPLLQEFNRAGVLDLADVHVADRLGALGGETDGRVLLAVALTVRALRRQSVCFDPAEVGRLDPALPWPEPDPWAAAIAASPLFAPGGPVRAEFGLLYLDRYWRQEVQVCLDLAERAAGPAPQVDPDRLQAALDRLFPVAPGSGGSGSPGTELVDDQAQRAAVQAAASGWTTVISGGPGTGKTTTVARLLAVLTDQPGPPLRIGLAAPTGKAAARLQEAIQWEASRFAPADRDRVAHLTASTLHRLLGWTPESRSRFAHRRSHRLPHDLVVVDEASMLSLTLTARLLEALRPDARLVLVGDPHQLASVEAGAVLADLVQGLTRREERAENDPDGHSPDENDAAQNNRAGNDPARNDPAGHDRAGNRRAGNDPAGNDGVEGDAARSHPAAAATVGGGRRTVVTLQRIWRFGAAIAELADAVKAGDAAAALAVLGSGSVEVSMTGVDPASGPVDEQVRATTVDHARALAQACAADDVAGAFARLDEHRLLCAHRAGPAGVQRWDAVVDAWIGRRGRAEWYPGRPLLAVANDPTLGLFNGDVGVVVRQADGSVAVVFARGNRITRFAPSRLTGLRTAYAMTVHRSQGSQYRAVSLVLPPLDSPLLTRELLYTGLTRARDRVRILGTAEQIRAAITTTAVRASGLRERLQR